VNVSVSQGSKCPLNPKVGHGPEAMAVAAGVHICTVHTVVDPNVAVGLSLNGRISPWTRHVVLDEVTRFVRRAVISEIPNNRLFLSLVVRHRICMGTGARGNGA
jgi:hypothetical protein